MKQVEFQNAKDQVEATVQNINLIIPGHDAARNHLRALLKASPQDLTHNDMPLPEKPVFQAVAGALVMAIPGAARVVVPDTGHLPYLEKPDLFSSIVIRFLTSHGF